MKKLLIIFIISIFAVSAFAQLKETAEIQEHSATQPYGVQPAVTPFSLLDFSRITWSHSYSVSYFSGGGSSNSLGLWQTQMMYEFSPKLSLAVNVGVAHNPGAIWGDERNQSSVLPGFQLDYKPSKNFHISVGMQTYRGNPYYNPYYNSNDRFLEDYFR